MKKVQQALINIQRDLHAPKSQYNSFSKYSYRNCEDILEALKPLLVREQCVMTINDNIVNIGDRYYVEAVIMLSHLDEEDGIVNKAYAREPVSKSANDESQVTGSTSSYARKYALNGLFLIDDTKDADFHDNTEKAPKKVVSVPSNGAADWTKGSPTQKQVDMLKKNGKWVEGMTFEEASKEIGLIINKQ